MLDFTDMATKGMGATMTLPNGRILRLKEEADQHTTVHDFTDNFGEVAHTDYDRDTGLRKPRPAAFDGKARIIRTYDGEYWWQPPDGYTDEGLALTLNVLTDILSYGFREYTLELCEGSDAYGRPIVIGYATMAGIEPFIKPDDLSWLLHDLFNDFQGADGLPMEALS